MPLLALHAATTTATTTHNCSSWRCDRNRTRCLGGGRFFLTDQTACLVYANRIALPAGFAASHAKRRGSVGG